MAGVRNNFSASIYSTAVISLGQIALVPLFIHSWGTSLYGQWLVLFTLPMYLTLSDFGLVDVLGNELIIAVEKKEFSRARNMLGAVWRFQGLFALGILLLACVVPLLLPVRHWLKVDSVRVDEFIAIFLCLGFYCLLTIQAGVIATIYRAARAMPKCLLSMGHFRLVEVGAVSVALLSGGSMLGVAAVMAGARLVWIGSLYSGARHLVPELQLSWTAGEWKDFCAMLPAGARYFVFPVGGALINQGVTLVINFVGGPAAVVLISVCRQVARLFIQLSSIVFTSVHPELTTAFARNDFPRMRRLQAGALMAIALAGLVFSLGTAIGGPWVVQHWTGSVEVSAVLIGFFALESATAAFANVARLLPWAVSRLGALPVGFVATNAVALLACLLFYQSLGPVVVPLSFMVANLVFAGAALKLSLAILDCPLGDFARSGGAALREIRGFSRIP